MSAIRIMFVFMFLTLVSSAFADLYKDPQGHYSFEVPSGWKAASSGDGGVIVTDGAAAYAKIVPVLGGGKDGLLVQHVTDQIGMQWQNFTQGEHGNTPFAGRQGIYVFFDGVNPKGVQAFMRIVVASIGDDATMLIVSCPSADLNTTKTAFLQIEHSFKLSAGAVPAQGKPSTGPLPAHGSPKGLESLDEPTGGRLLTGTLKDVTSGPAAFVTGLRHTIGYFDASPNLLSVVRSKNDQVTMATFSAVLHKSPVVAMAISTFDPNGNSRFSLLIDTPERFPKSLPTMLHHIEGLTAEAVERSRPTGGGGIDFGQFQRAAQDVALSPFQFQDGTATVGVAAGFTPHVARSAQFNASNAAGSYINMYQPLNLLDPRGSLYRGQVQFARGGIDPLLPGQVAVPYTTDPVSAWKQCLAYNARKQNASDPSPQVQATQEIPGLTGGWIGKVVCGTMTLQGHKVAFTGSLLAGPAPGPNGSWTLLVSMLAAPVERASVDMPALIAMQMSQKVNQGALNEQTLRLIEQTRIQMAERAVAFDQAQRDRFEHSQAVLAANRDALDKSTAGFINYLRDQAVLQHNPTGAAGTLDSDLANALQQVDPVNFTVLKPSEYVKGRDY